MKKNLIFLFAAVAALILAAGCSHEEDPMAPCSYRLEKPDVKVRALTSDGFVLQWDAVENAVSYTLVFDGGEEQTVTDRRMVFSGLDNHTEYVISVRADGEEPFVSSDCTYVHVFTDELLPLAAPEITLGCAYASRTVITWSMVEGAAGYEYTIGGKTYTTAEPKATMTDLVKGTEYRFSVKAVSANPQNWMDSDEAVLDFTTSVDDVPAYLIVPTDIVADAVAYDIYAVAGDLYYYDVVPAYLLNRLSEEEIIESYHTAILEYARQQGISLQLALGSVLKSGTSSMTKTGLTSEMTYAVIAFGMTIKGEVTSGLSYATFKTKALGESDGPNFGGSPWFSQSYYLSNSYAAAGYTWMNSVVALWMGQDVKSIRYRTLPTSSFRQVFPDPSDTEAIKAFLRDERYSYAGTEAHLAGTNSNNGCVLITSATAGASYTLSTLATDAGGEETLCVNSVTTKTELTDRAWFAVSAVVSETYGPTHNIVTAGFKGVDIVSARFAWFQSSALANIPVSRYPDLVADEELGHDIAEENIPYINGGGLAYRLNASPSTKYTVIGTAVNSVGDRITKYATVTTTAAPEEDVQLAKMSAGQETASCGEVMLTAPWDKELFPLVTVMAPARADLDGDDIWTAIHNMKILEKRYLTEHEK
ncbi:MAG: fibronectin type III domain-containing protein [Clostridium sp.]|nr:fibronectin type III domain-containing protein [Bacteroides sp.]MCM1198372.1 fibronectin type III domain-containing protein [Clostridium sp.]